MESGIYQTAISCFSTETKSRTLWRKAFSNWRASFTPLNESRAAALGSSLRVSVRAQQMETQLLGSRSLFSEFFMSKLWCFSVSFTLVFCQVKTFFSAVSQCDVPQMRTL